MLTTVLRIPVMISGVNTDFMIAPPFYNNFTKTVLYIG